MIRIGILGCGRIARLYHLEILARAPEVEITTLEGGVRVESRVSFTGSQENRFEVMGEEGTLRVDRIEGRLTLDGDARCLESELAAARGSRRVPVPAAP